MLAVVKRKIRQGRQNEVEMSKKSEIKEGEISW